MTMLPAAERARLRGARGRGSLRCKACGDTLYLVPGALVPHRGTQLMIPMHVAAARLRNHLRRLAILRLGLIEGDCYLLPYYRVEGATPDGETTFTILAARLGDARLDRAFLPPGDLRAWEEPDPAAAGSPSGAGAGVRILEPTLSWEEAGRRHAAEGWEARRVLELIHYPFWLMRVHDCGRIEGAWMDAIEAKLIFHRIRLSPPIPSRNARLLWTALPAAAALAGAIAAPAAALPLSLAAWGAGVPLLHAALTRRWNG